MEQAVPRRRTRVDFARLAAELLQQAEALLAQWLPGGARQGHEYKGCPTSQGGDGDSWSVNLNTGAWAHFAGDDRGKDLVSLYAALNGLDNVEAARELIADHALEGVALVEVDVPVQTSASPLPQSAADRPPGRTPRRESSWKAIAPVPATAPPARFAHYHFGEPSRHWEYRVADQLMGYVLRFDRPQEDGTVRKEVLPLTWCQDQNDPRGLCKWTNKQWDEPRPLYIPGGHVADDLPFVVPEGEKCAELGDRHLGAEFNFVSWPGGGKAWAKAGWEMLRGRVVYLWPDCDAKRFKLTADEKKAGIDPATKHIMPPEKQPGMQTMVGLGNYLATELGCRVFMCGIPAPGAVVDGWDLADALEDGWSADQVGQFIRGAKPFQSPDAAVRAAARELPPPPMAGAGEDDSAGAWRVKLLTSLKGAVLANRENAVVALDGLPSNVPPVRGIPECEGVFAFNAFTNEVLKLKPTPWGSEPGKWSEVDDLQMGEYLVRQHGMPSMSRQTLEEAVMIVAHRRAYHPVREYLGGLQWDGQERLKTWLRRVCLTDVDTFGLNEFELQEHRNLMRYLARAGTWFMMGMVSRVMTPGVKFDYMLILEGAQGIRKSTLFCTLAGDWFADSGINLSDRKEAMQQLQGRLLYEIAELDAFNKTDITAIKQFIASSSDYFRASFDRRARDYPRQLVFGGTTNEDHYLVDPTGNRRFWPVRCTRQVLDIDWLVEHRDQLFAEAMHRVQAGARMHPTPDEEKALFQPQQQLRTVENAIESRLASYLYANQDGLLVNEISLVDLLGKIGIGVEKLGPGRFHEKQAAAALRKFGWCEGRSSVPPRPRVYKRPKDVPASASSSTGHAGHLSARAEDDDCPF